MLAKDSSDFHPFSHVIEHRGVKSELDELMLAKILAVSTPLVML